MLGALCLWYPWEFVGPASLVPGYSLRSAALDREAGSGPVYVES
jgi:hypothetical protein